LKTLEEKYKGKLIGVINQQIKGSLHEESFIRERLMDINYSIMELGFTTEKVVQSLF
jgi:hypothetical protein